MYKLRSNVEILDLSNEFVVASFGYEKYLSIEGSKDILGFTFKYREDPIILDPRNKSLGARLIINLEKLYLSLKKLDLKDKLTKLKVDQTKELRKREKLDEDRSNWSQNGLSNIKDKFKITKKLKAKNITHVKVFLNVDSSVILEEEGPTYAPESPPPNRE